METKDAFPPVNWTNIKLKRKCLELIRKIAARGEQTIEWAGVEHALTELAYVLYHASVKGHQLNDPSELLSELGACGKKP
jgi:hypothetical protein